MRKAFIQFLRFGIVGLINTFVSQAVYMLCIAAGFHYFAASAAAFVISVFSAFLFQSTFVFKEQRDKEKRVWWQVLLKTYASYAFTGLFLNNVLLFFWIDVIHVENYTMFLTELFNEAGVCMSNDDVAKDIAPLLNIVINVPINFVFNKFWAYKQKERDANEYV